MNVLKHCVLITHVICSCKILFVEFFLSLSSIYGTFCELGCEAVDDQQDNFSYENVT